MRILFPLSANPITPGHIKCLQGMSRKDRVYASILTDKALEGYKKERVPYPDRLFILQTVASGMKDVRVIPQHSLDPTDNLKKFKCKALASGDGFEETERKAAEDLNIKLIDFKLPNETIKRYNSSNYE